MHYIRFICVLYRTCYVLQMQALTPAFFHRFGHLLPPVITVNLPNGQTFTGSYSPPAKIVGLRIFQEGEAAVLTYCGDGRFDGIVFCPDAVEKSHSTGINFYTLMHPFIFN